MSLKAEIIGGGIAGLTAAISLARAGARVTLHEQAHAFGEVGAGLQVSANAMRALRALDLEDGVLARASFPEAVLLRDGLGGEIVARVPLGSTAEARWGARHGVIHRADLIDVLARAASQAGIDIRLGTRVATLPQDGLVVAADGLRSALRGQAFGHDAPRFSGHVAWRALVPVEDAPMVTDNWMLPGRHVITYPLRRDTGLVMNIVAIETAAGPVAEGWREEGDVADLRRRFSDGAPALQALLERVESVHRWGIYAREPLGTWAAANLLLIGDAAHPMVPFLAQGAAMAMEDAVSLGDAAADGGEPADIARRVSALRAARAHAVMRASAGAGRIYHHKGPMRRARNLALAAMGRTAPTYLIRRMDWLYGGGPR